jgi:hypothetical protein
MILYIHCISLVLQYIRIPSTVQYVCTIHTIEIEWCRTDENFVWRLNEHVLHALVLIAWSAVPDTVVL